MSRRDGTGFVGSIGRFLRAAALGLTTVGLAAVLTIPTTMTASADPPLTVAEAKARIDQLETDAAAIDQDYVGVREQIKQGKSRLKVKQADMEAQTARVKRLRHQVGQVALAQFQNRNLDTAAQLFVTQDTESFLSQISTVEKVSENQNLALQNYQLEQANLADLQLSAETDLAALAEQEKQLQALRTASDKKIAESKAVLAKLSAEEQRRIAEEERRATQAAQKDAEQAGGQQADDTTEQTSDVPAATGGGRGAKALAFARAQLGKPYRFGATGPNAYDCSGLTGSAWRSVGVSLPRTSQQQYRAGRSVAKSDLQLGDLVFFYPGSISHVGLYAGNGTIIHASRPGKPVQYIKMAYMPYAGSRRPG